MNTSRLITLCLIFSGLAARAQNADPNSGSATTTTVPDPTPAEITEVGPHHRVWQWQEFEQLPNGQVVSHNHQYTELASGLNVQDPTSGQWIAADDSINTFSGGAIVQHCQHQVIFGNNLNTFAAVDLQTADGKRLRSNILGLMYYDPTTGQAVQIAEVQDSDGELIANNEVLYPNAFSGINADVLYKNRLDGIEQDVILREQPAAPEAYGMNSATAELEVFTEFINPPAATVTDSTIDDATLETDQNVNWGLTGLGHGKAFSLGGEDAPTTVVKRYVTINGRYFLLEKVRLEDIQQALSNLPPQASNASRKKGMASKHFKYPKQLLAKTESHPLRLAMSEIPSKGYVLDYVTESGSTNNFTFQGDTTYYLSGTFTLGGTDYFEGGAVIKYASGASIVGASGSQFVFKSSPYRPVVFTAKDDNGPGQGITGSTGSPSGYYANPALNLTSMGSLSLSDFRILYANRGLSVSGASPAVYDAQFVNCGVAVSDINGTVTLENALFSNTKTNFNATSAVNTVLVEQATFNNEFDLINGSFGSTSLRLTNCAFVNVTNLSGNIAAGYNGFYKSPEVGAFAVTNTFYPLQAAGGANCYLTNGCYFVNAGATNIDPYALTLIGAKTTYAPVIYSNLTFSVVTNFSQMAQRDTDTPDLGYHYDPLDYVFGAVTVKSNMTFTAGTAVGFFYNSSGASSAVSLGDSATMNFTGTATSPCRWARSNTVQEGNGNWTAASYLGGIVGQSYSHAAPAIQGFFLDCYELAQEGNLFRDNSTLMVVNAQNSEFYSGNFGAYTVSINLTNCLFVNGLVGIYNNYGSANLTMLDCTAIRGSLTADNTSGTAWPVTILNCAFDQSVLYMNAHGGTTNGYRTDYNSFIYGFNTTTNLGGHEVIVTNSYNWQASWLGYYYLPTNSTLIDKGSTTANLLGLYQFTTQTNQLIEGNSTVDIGYHYVATDTNGVPLDGNGDGVPDYLEDANGNGLFDAGDLGNWQYARTNSGSILFTNGTQIYVFEPKPTSSIP